MNNLRNLAILLLDDENGICDAAYNVLFPHLDSDIVDAVRCQDNRYFLNEDDAERLKQVVLAENYVPAETPLGEQIEGD